MKLNLLFSSKMLHHQLTANVIVWNELFFASLFICDVLGDLIPLVQF